MHGLSISPKNVQYGGGGPGGLSGGGGGLGGGGLGGGGGGGLGGGGQGVSVSVVVFQHIGLKLPVEFVKSPVALTMRTMVGGGGGLGGSGGGDVLFASSVAFTKFGSSFGGLTTACAYVGLNVPSCVPKSTHTTQSHHTTSCTGL